MTTVILFLLVLSVLVLIHEAGHYVAARLFGVKADEFGYGFPPRLIGFVKDKGIWKRVGRKDEQGYANTIWSINWLPLGGFVRIKGEQGEDEHDPDSFHVKPIWQRIVILVAGVFMNWILAVVLFSCVFMIGTRAVIDDVPAGARIQDRTIEITQVLSGSPAASAGLEVTDAIRSIDGTEPQTQEDARRLIASAGERAITILIDRHAHPERITVTPVFLEQINKTGIGVGLADVGYVSFGPFQAVHTAVLSTWGYGKAIFLTFGSLIRDLVTTHAVSQDVAGPIGIAVMTGKIAEQGIIPLLQFAAILSINLAIINILPIPALDGGRIAFLFIEKIRRRPMRRALEAAIHNGAFIFLLLLMVLVTIHDLSRYGGAIVNGVRGWVGM